MQPIQYIKKKIGNSYLVWFKKSNQYIQFEEPAWFVFQKTVGRYKTETITQLFSIRYDHTYETSHKFVTEIRLKIEELNQIVNAKPNYSILNTELDFFNFTSYSVHQYKLGIKSIFFNFESLQFENFIHPLLSHLETSVWISSMSVYELFKHNESIVFRYNGEVKGVWGKDDAIYVKGFVFMYLINEMYDKSDTDWLLTVHASAITNGNKTILLSAAPGNGKTTMAALLLSRGYKLVSDDFVPLDIFFKAYAFPIAMSVKEGSSELLESIFPELNKIKINNISPNKKVRYLPSPIDEATLCSTLPVKELIFIEYDRTIDFVFEKLDTFQSLKFLFDEVWINPGSEYVPKFMEWVTQTDFYVLRYSDNQKAITAITNLFEND